MDACLAGEGVALASAVLASHALASGTLKVVSPIGYLEKPLELRGLA
jgi:hypothetical protein